MSYPRQLGVIPAALVAVGVNELSTLIKSWGSGALTNEQLSSAGAAVQGFIATVETDLANIADPSTTAGYTFSRLRCLGGDLSEDVAFQATAAPYCGFAEQSSRVYTRAAVILLASKALAAGITVPKTYTFRDVNAAGGGNVTLTASAALANQVLAPVPSTPSETPGGTLPIPVGGGYTVGVPVPSSSILDSTVGGVPVVAWAAGLLVVGLMLGGRKR